MYTKTVIAAGLLGLAQAQSYTPPGAQTFGALYTPDLTHPATQGSVLTVTWDPKGHLTDTISLVLCRGNGNNCERESTAIVSGYPAASASYNWNVPCSQPIGQANTATGYGMLIIADGSGDFQYSTQFSVLGSLSCGSGANSTSSTTTASKTSTTAYTSSTWAPWSSSMTTTSWTAPGNYSHTTMKPTQPSTVVLTTTPSHTTAAATVTPSQFHGSAVRIGGSAAALVMAAGAALFAL